LKIKALYLKNFFFFLNKYFSSLFSVTGSRKTVLFDFGQADLKRPGYLITTLLLRNGYRIFVKADPKKLLKTGVFGRAIFKDPAVKLTMKTPQTNLYIGEGKGEGHKSLSLDFDLFDREEERKNDNIIFTPLIFHPNFLKDRYFNKTDDLASHIKRPIPLLFAGNFSRKQYDRPDTKALFNVLTRYEIIEFLRSHLSSEQIFEPHSLEELNRALDNHELKGRFVLCDTSLFSIPQDKWFEMLSQAQFFLSPPGVVQPFCHNTVESMAVSTIPVLQYPKVYYPEMENGKNCLVFHSEQDLLTLVNKILLDEYATERLSLSKEARTYYEKNLSPSAFNDKLNRFIESEEKTGRLMVCQNTLSTALLKKRRNLKNG
jgi:hypothetical protein